MTIFITEMSINLSNGSVSKEEATIRLVNSGPSNELVEFLTFFRDKGVFSTESLTSYLIHRKLKESNG